MKVAARIYRSRKRVGRPVTMFGTRAENAAASLIKGDTVIVAGDPRVEGFTRTDGTPGQSNEIIAGVLGASIRYVTVTTEPAARTTA